VNQKFTTFDGANAITSNDLAKAFTAWVISQKLPDEAVFRKFCRHLALEELLELTDEAGRSAIDVARPHFKSFLNQKRFCFID
jgi:hypothetical protein